MYRLFIDEVGHDNLKSANDSNEQHLCLMGVIMNGRGHWDLKQRMDTLKKDIFATEEVVLHRREIIDQDPPFDVLRDPVIRARFDAGIMDMIANCSYTALTVQIDKKAHLEKYAVWQHNPYHYCLTAMLERYVMFLKEIGKAKNGDVMAEWRGIEPNMRLERAFRYVYQNGTGNISEAEAQSYLSTSQLKIEKKEANVSGLQLADLIASPANRHLVCRRKNEIMKAPFGIEVVKILHETKYRRSDNGVIEGYGIKGNNILDKSSTRRVDSSSILLPVYSLS